MGSKKTKTKQSNRPIYSSQVLGAANSQQAAYDRQAPAISQFSDNAMNASQGLFDQYQQGDPTIQAAQGYVRDQLAMQPGDNPYLNDIISQTGDNTRRQLQTQLGTRGGIGGSSELDIVGRALAQNESGLRYQDYNNLANRQMQAAGMAPGLLQGSYAPLQAALQSGSQGAMLPLQAALANSAGVGGLLGQYQDVEGEQRQSGGLLGQILSSAVQGGTMALMCDIRLKENITRVGETPAGLPLYVFDYIGGEKGVLGPMAHEVAAMQPEALGPVLHGFMGVIPVRLQ